MTLQDHYDFHRRRYEFEVERFRRQTGRGVCWSGMDPWPPLPKTGRDLWAAAEESWRREREEAGKLENQIRLQVAACLGTLSLLSERLEDVSSAISRDGISKPDPLHAGLTAALAQARELAGQILEAHTLLDLTTPETETL